MPGGPRRTSHAAAVAVVCRLLRLAAAALDADAAVACVGERALEVCLVKLRERPRS